MRFFLLPILLILLANSSYTQDTIVLNDNGHWKPIGKKTFYYRDPDFKSIEQILEKDFQSKFKAYHQDVPNFGSTSDAAWLRFTIKNESAIKYYLQIGSPFIDSIELYAIDNNHVEEVQVSGDNYTFPSRAVKVTTFLFPLKIDSGATQTFLLRTRTMQPFFYTLRVGSLQSFMENTHKLDLVQGIYLGFMLLIFFYNLFLYFSTKEKLYLFYVAYVAAITWFMSTVFQYVFEFLWPEFPIINQYAVASSAFTMLTATLFTREFLHTRMLAPKLHKVSLLFLIWGLLSFLLVFTPLKIAALQLAQGGIMLMAIYFLIAGIVVYKKGYHPAKFYLIAWSFLILGFIAAILETVNLLPVMFYINSMQIGSAIEVTLLSLALADRINMYKKEREEAQLKALNIAQEQADLIQKQNIILEEKVTHRTEALTKSLEDLKEAQAQLIQSEKMASLGELTAGIAHEIQNPLNFVNNFSEVSNELVDEMTAELDKGDLAEAKEIAADIKENLAKITNHGKRAESIVKGMLAHSRRSNELKEATDINALVEEYAHLSYASIRAKDKSFHAAITMDLDRSIEKIEMVPQNIGRVLLNLINNALYAVDEKKKSGIAEFEPRVSISTKNEKDQIYIIVKDNGSGIPASMKEKIFQPFFTTKPTGQGTGLGLSLSYDIVKMHNGDIRLEKSDESGSEFSVRLPATS